MKIEKKVGRKTYEFTVEGENLHEAVMESKKLSFYDVHKCGCCQSDDLVLDAHVAQGKFKYTTVKCNACKASVNFGQQQENSDVFYLRTRNKADNTGKEVDWKPAPANPHGEAAQQVNNYASNTAQVQNPGAPVPPTQPRQ